MSRILIRQPDGRLAPLTAETVIPALPRPHRCPCCADGQMHTFHRGDGNCYQCEWVRVCPNPRKLSKPC